MFCNLNLICTGLNVDISQDSPNTETHVSSIKVFPIGIDLFTQEISSFASLFPVIMERMTQFFLI
jgi:hypothetical protein